LSFHPANRAQGTGHASGSASATARLKRAQLSNAAGNPARLANASSWRSGAGIENGKSAATTRIPSPETVSAVASSAAVQPGGDPSSRALSPTGAIAQRRRPSRSAATARIFRRCRAAVAGPAKSIPTTVARARAPGVFEPMAKPSRFDAAYFERFYHAPGKTHSAPEIARLASGVAGIAAWLGVELESVLDVGAGTGIWRSWFRRHRPAVRYRSIDVSPYACERYGHEQRDISRWRARERFDLVVCHAVLQYLEDEAAARALENLGAMSRGLLYLEVVTKADLAILDTDKTDMNVHARTGRWYRARLGRHFDQVGAGLWLSKRSPVQLWELEGAGRQR
jgi:SAM-dependent methyltransferase